jgi:hypothetical protein
MTLKVAVVSYVFDEFPSLIPYDSIDVAVGV